MGLTLSSSSRELLREVLVKRQPSLLDVVDRTADPTLEILSLLIDEVVGDELADTGFGTNSEPNPRGHALENLIDELNRIRWRRLGASR